MANAMPRLRPARLIAGTDPKKSNHEMEKQGDFGCSQSGFMQYAGSVLRILHSIWMNNRYLRIASR